MKWTQAAGKRALRKDFRLPSAGEMPGWISRTAREAGGQFTPQAAQTLAGLIGSDTQLAKREIEKLLMYVDSAAGGSRRCDRMYRFRQHGQRVAMTDALAEGDASSALRLLHRLMEDEDPMGLFAVIVAHFRGLLVTREILDEGGGAAPGDRSAAPAALCGQ